MRREGVFEWRGRGAVYTDQEPVRSFALCFRLCGLQASDLIPHLYDCCSQLTVMAGRNIVAWTVEEIGDRVMDGDETLEMSS